MDKRTKRRLVAWCLRAAAGFGLINEQVKEQCSVSRRTVQREIRRGDDLSPSHTREFDRLPITCDLSDDHSRQLVSGPLVNWSEMRKRSVAA